MARRDRGSPMYSITLGHGPLSVFYRPPYTGKQDCGARSDELEYHTFKMGNNCEAGLYNGMIANLADSVFAQ
jgi:hypothetical protein